MSLEAVLSSLSPDRDTVLTIGVFDGVHLGHKYLLSKLIERAKERGLMSGVVTFGTHPQKTLSPETRLPFLTDLARKQALLKSAGVEAVIVLPFSEELARLGARQFVGLLKSHLRMKELLVGPDFALGRNREGDVKTLRALGEAMGFMVTEVPPVLINGEVASSTTIRKSLADGDLKRAASLIGSPFSLRERVITGEGRGIKLGFPTANLELDPEQALPADGVYATWAYIGDAARESVTYIGRRPTFGGGQSVVEVYLIGYQGDLYGQELKIDIIERLRGERQFDSAEALKEQIARDVKQVGAILKSKHWE